MTQLNVLSEADYKKILDHIQSLEQTILSFAKKHLSPLSEQWLDNQEVIELLHVSKRKLQDMRDKGEIPFSKIGAKIYYKASDIEKMLNLNYVKAYGK